MAGILGVNIWTDKNDIITSVLVAYDDDTMKDYGNDPVPTTVIDFCRESTNRDDLTLSNGRTLHAFYNEGVLKCLVRK